MGCCPLLCPAAVRQARTEGRLTRMQCRINGTRMKQFPKYCIYHKCIDDKGVTDSGAFCCFQEEAYVRDCRLDRQQAGFEE